jgi:hypothetical protein
LKGHPRAPTTSLRVPPPKTKLSPAFSLRISTHTSTGSTKLHTSTSRSRPALVDGPAPHKQQKPTPWRATTSSTTLAPSSCPRLVNGSATQSSQTQHHRESSLPLPRRTRGYAANRIAVFAAHATKHDPTNEGVAAPTSTPTLRSRLCLVDDKLRCQATHPAPPRNIRETTSLKLLRALRAWSPVAALNVLCTATRTAVAREEEGEVLLRGYRRHSGVAWRRLTGASSAYECVICSRLAGLNRPYQLIIRLTEKYGAHRTHFIAKA